MQKAAEKHTVEGGGEEDEFFHVESDSQKLLSSTSAPVSSPITVQQQRLEAELKARADRLEADNRELKAVNYQLQCGLSSLSGQVSTLTAQVTLLLGAVKDRDAQIASLEKESKSKSPSPGVMATMGNAVATLCDPTTFVTSVTKTAIATVVKVAATMDEEKKTATTPKKVPEPKFKCPRDKWHHQHFWALGRWWCRRHADCCKLRDAASTETASILITIPTTTTTEGKSSSE
jgi:hypothetical protein